jgi:hypothetical protein
MDIRLTHSNVFSIIPAQKTGIDPVTGFLFYKYDNSLHVHVDCEPGDFLNFKEWPPACKGS